VVTANFSQVAVGQSIEAIGAVAPGLKIDAKGTGVKVARELEPIQYVANQGSASIANGFLADGGGFSDSVTRNAGQPHLYTFSFASGTTVSNFSLRMLDFGDLNPTASTDHYVSMTAYNGFGEVVSKQEISYTTLAVTLPESSDKYGDLSVTGDASALPGQLGNWTWNVSGSGIVRVVLEFGVGFDPNIAFDTLTFTIQCE
jgi:hypothetical protein